MPKAGADFEQFSEFNLYDDPWFRLKSIQLSYNMPQGVLSSLNMDNVRVYVSGYNLLTISELNGIDPGGRPDTGRTDANYYPQLKTVNTGVEVSF